MCVCVCRCHRTSGQVREELVRITFRSFSTNGNAQRKWNPQLIYIKFIWKWIITIFHFVLKPHKFAQMIRMEEGNDTFEEKMCLSLSEHETQPSSSYHLAIAFCNWHTDLHSLEELVWGYNQWILTWSIFTGHWRLARNHTKMWPSSQAASKNVVPLFWLQTPLVPASGCQISCIQ